MRNLFKEKILKFMDHSILFKYYIQMKKKQQFIKFYSTNK